ncbi:DUF4132 domain-containing protein [Phytomonospora endophytica]|uniref:DUF4132 domain-containing protein n=1 Tax=Phytomonospora endophytica TaxID=714109 RepID=A0A841FG19_9ACTN|nr:DUF4132 domain-containing protein [Phytomonospora endophytica]MBB6035206.1 hypothetical protein [Phytomonospora endophytica]GIG64045.1 hypothetical protein Pen01_03400 [Phytomonospora endophytica]
MSADLEALRTRLRERRDEREAAAERREAEVVAREVVGAAAASGDAEALADAFLATADHPSVWAFWSERLRPLSREDRAHLVRILGERVESIDDADVAGLVTRFVLHTAKDMAPTLNTARAALGQIARQWKGYPFQQLPELAALLTAAGEITGPMIAGLRRSALWYGTSMLRELPAAFDEMPLNPGEAWSDEVLGALPSLGTEWRGFLLHMNTAHSAKPSAKWAKRTREFLATLGEGVVVASLVEWLALLGRPRTLPLDDGSWGDDINGALDPFNATAVRGMLWTLGMVEPTAESARCAARVVEYALKKVPGIGPHTPKVANAGVHALSAMDSADALGQLARLATRVTYKGTLKLLEATLDAKAVALGLSREEIEEMAVPAYGLGEVGRHTELLGDVTVELIADDGVRLQWTNAAGRTVKSVPASVKRDHAERLAELKAAVKDVAKMLTAQVERVDKLFLARREWRYDQWRERYLDHPLVGVVARRLLWTVGETAVGYADGELRAHDDAPVAVADDAVVRLWHPLGHEVAEVLAWREWLERHGITQPFKQAHREVYPLTAAEENTRVYSNRFAAHVIRQHQFSALAAIRGWDNRLRLMVDDSYPPATRRLPQWNLRAEFWVEGIGDDYGADTTDAGTYLRLATDQVRFYPLDAPTHFAHAGGGPYEQWLHGEEPVEPLPLSEIPPLVLSEVLRDVDLFVGVSSVGNDPTWQDGGPEGRFRDYWQSYSFGELSGTANTRREILARLVPRLAIADVATVEDRFLVVRGKGKWTYKIHLGSGNILMSPGDRYLCIVPGQSAGRGPEKLYLPFEGDRTLAIILSKAMLLAKDDEITDPTITRQLR